jgi:Family of unknown function (DUF5684)
MLAMLSFCFLVLLPIVGWVKIFDKANIAAWAAIPGIHWLGMLKLAGWSYLWIIALFTPLAPLAHVLFSMLVARRFGRSLLFGMGMAVLPFVFVPLLGFSEARYLGPDR